MAISINGKPVRSLPEQVSFCVKRVDELEQVIREQEYAIDDIKVENSHLIFTLANGEVIDAGDIFNGDVDVNGDLTANLLLEKMSGYSFVEGSTDPNYGDGVTDLFASVVKTGNKITFVISGELQKPAGAQTTSQLGHFTMPAAIYNKLVPDSLSSVDNKLLYLAKNRSSVGESLPVAAIKGGSNTIYIYCYGTNTLGENDTYVFRYEVTFLLSDNMI